MAEDSIDNSNNILSNFKTLAKSISSAQSNIFRCKSTLKSIEEELIYSNVNNNTNTNNRESKKPEESSELGFASNNMVEIDAEPMKSVDYFTKYSYLDTLNKNLKSRKGFPKILMSQNLESHNNFSNRNSNVCNISGELTNLMRSQQKLICQIEQLKCEIGEKSGAIDICIRDNQYFNCKFKEVECDIDQLKRDVDKIKKDLALNSNRDRGYSPYSQESCRKDNLNIQPPLKNFNGRLSAGEIHYGYQDVCTPDNSILNGPMMTKSNRNILLNVRDPQGNSRTFEDLMKKSKLDIDCNINNCRNNQNVVSLMNSKQNNPVLNDFANLTSQIKNLRKMAESIFKVNNNNFSLKKSNPTNHTLEPNISKLNEMNHDDHSKSSNTKPVVETTLSMLNQSNVKLSGLSNPSNITKRDTSSESTSVSGSDTSACFYTEDQLPIFSPQKNAGHHNKKSKDQDHCCIKDLHVNNHLMKCSNNNRKYPNIQKHVCNEPIKKHTKCKDNYKSTKKQELCINCTETSFQCSKPSESCSCAMKNQICHSRPICPECNQFLSIFGN